MTDPKPRLPFIATTPAWRIPRLRLVDTAAPPTPTVTVDTHSSGPVSYTHLTLPTNREV